MSVPECRFHWVVGRPREQGGKETRAEMKFEGVERVFGEARKGRV